MRRTGYGDFLSVQLFFYKKIRDNIIDVVPAKHFRFSLCTLFYIIGNHLSIKFDKTSNDVFRRGLKE